MNRRSCSRCLNDYSVKKISFDENHLCNYCSAFEKYEKRLKNFDSLERNFLKRLKALEGEFLFDCALGISGGKDSSFILYQLVKVYHLKVATFTIDNGFLSEEARANVDSLVSFLGVPHEYLKPDQEFMARMYRYSLKHFLSPCVMCSYLGYAMMVNYTTRINARVGINGRSPYQMLRYFEENNHDPFNEFVLEGLKEDGIKDFKYLFEKVLDSISRYVSKEISKEIKEKLLTEAYNGGFREFIPYFLYHPYNEKEIVKFLKEKTPLDLTDKKEHYDCEVHLASTYIKDIIARRPHFLPELSVKIRLKELSREEGLKILAEYEMKSDDEQLSRLTKFCKVNKHELMAKAKIYSKRWW